MIVTDTNNLVMGSSYLIERVDEEDEIGLIKVYTAGLGVGYYYIGTEDRDSYTIYTDVDLLVPNENGQWSYDGLVFNKIDKIVGLTSSVS